MTQFEKACKEEIKCDVCGKPMIPMYGEGWDNDRLVCADVDYCGAEIVYPTSTEYKKPNSGLDNPEVAV